MPLLNLNAVNLTSATKSLPASTVSGLKAAASTIKTKIRNIIQSTQEREIIKLAPDLVVYIGGQNYLINPNIGGANGTSVPFNDYIAAWNGSYDVDAMIPTGTLTLAVPREQDSLFRSPGGNNILKSMDDIRVFEKGYYLSPAGNSIYYQTFKGYISSISYSETGTMTNITIGCRGSMGLLERMQIDLAPGVMSSSPLGVTPYGSVQWNLNPYQMIAWAMTYKSFTDGFTLSSINQSNMGPGNEYWGAVQQDYVAKWLFILADLARDVHIFGAPDPSDIVKELPNHLSPNPESITPQNKNTAAIADDSKGTKSESDATSISTSQYNRIKAYHPDHLIGDIQLLNGKTTSRLERLRTAASLVGFEAYQDLDGSIIVKPPVYNLDVTNMAAATSQGLDNTVDNITAERNPFVVYLSEIINESEVEDEAEVRLTRITAKGTMTGPENNFMGNTTDTLVATVEDIDIAKLSQFGLRTETPLKCEWMFDSDHKGLYGFAAGEMAKANLGLRKYSITIPSRPELKLGFPMYLPHRDIYGYIKNISSSYSKGGESTMTVSLTGLRRRPLFPVQQNIPNSNGTTQTKTLLTPQPDLVTAWTVPLANTSTASIVASIQAVTGTSAVESSLPITKPASQDVVLHDHRKKHIGSYVGTQTDTPVKSWRIQPDIAKKFSSGVARIVDATYYNDIFETRPYTDDKGYELISPFPWGRWVSLKQALYDFTVYEPSSEVSKTKLPTTINPNTQEVSGDVTPFFFTGTATPSTTPDATSTMASTLQDQAQVTTNAKVFELSYGSSNVPSTLPGIDTANDTSNSTAAASNSNNTSTTDKVATFITGSPQQPNLATRIVNSTSTTGGN